MKTDLQKIDDIHCAEQRRILEEAGRIIRDGGLVAFPTETVYGLGGDAMNPEASARIYAAKGRPSDNPLIVHVCEKEQVRLVAAEVSPAAGKLMEAFWPGPLTLIFPKRPEVPDATTGGLSTVAVRFPSHPAARAFIRESRTLIAAPSANLSGRPSPTTAAHVYEDMKGRIPLILDGGPVGIGIESTIVDMTGERPVILRPGYITQEMLMETVGAVDIDPAVTSRRLRTDIVAKAPGMKYRHYAPKGQLTLFTGEENAVRVRINRLAWEKIRQGYRVGVIGTDETMRGYYVGWRRSIGSRKDPDSIAANLYRVLRECDALALDYIYSESFFEKGLGNAVMNRLLKAAGYQIVAV